MEEEVIVHGQGLGTGAILLYYMIIVITGFHLFFVHTL